MTGHGFHITGDPADLPPGAKVIEVNLTSHVEAAGRAIHEELKRPDDPEWEGLPPMERFHYMELGNAVVMALVERGWHTNEMHEAVAQAMEEEHRKHTPKTGMDPR